MLYNQLLQHDNNTAKVCLPRKQLDFSGVIVMLEKLIIPYNKYGITDTNVVLLEYNFPMQPQISKIHSDVFHRLILLFVNNQHYIDYIILY